MLRRLVPFGHGIVPALSGAPPRSRLRRPTGSPGRSEASGRRRSCSAGRFQLADESDDATLRSGLAAELKRLRAELHDKQGWADPLMRATRCASTWRARDGQGLRRLAARAVDRHRLVGAVDRDRRHRPFRAGNASRRRAALRPGHARGVRRHRPQLPVLRRRRIALRARDADEDRQERLRAAAAATALDLFRQADSLGRVYVEEFSRGRPGGAPHDLGAGRPVRRRGAVSLPEDLDRDDGGKGGPAPSSFRGPDVHARRAGSGAVARLALRSPERRARRRDPGDFCAAAPVVSSGAGRDRRAPVAWPERGALSAAVVRYRDAALPPDVVFWSPGTTRTIPLSGVSRVDWIVGGTAGGPPLEELSASVEPVAAFPLRERRAAGGRGPRRSADLVDHVRPRRSRGLGALPRGGAPRRTSRPNGSADPALDAAGGRLVPLCLRGFRRVRRHVLPVQRLGGDRRRASRQGVLGDPPDARLISGLPGDAPLSPSTIRRGDCRG